MKNECLKTRGVNEPYEVWRNKFSGWEWRVLKKYQIDDNKPYARWYCAVSSPMTHEGYDLGDVYVAEIKENGEKIQQEEWNLKTWKDYRK